MRREAVDFSGKVQIFLCKYTQEISNQPSMKRTGRGTGSNNTAEIEKKNIRICPAVLFPLSGGFTYFLLFR